MLLPLPTYIGITMFAAAHLYQQQNTNPRRFPDGRNGGRETESRALY